MKKVISLVLSLVFLLVCLAGCGQSAADRQSVKAIQKAGKLVIHTNAEFPPFEYVIDGNKVVGVDIDIAQAIADDLGVELQIENVKFDTILSAVNSGKASMGIAGMTVTEEREESVDFSVSYTTSKQYIVLPVASTVAKIEDMKGLRIGVQTGTTGDFIVTDEINGTEDDNGEHKAGVLEGTGATVTTYNNAADAAVAMKAGKLDAVVVDKLPAEIVAGNYKEEMKAIELVYADGSNTEESYAICVAQGNTTLLERINKVLNKLISEGKVDDFIINHTGAASK